MSAGDGRTLAQMPAAFAVNVRTARVRHTTPPVTASDETGEMNEHARVNSVSSSCAIVLQHREHVLRNHAAVLTDELAHAATEPSRTPARISAHARCEALTCDAADARCFGSARNHAQVEQCAVRRPRQVLARRASREGGTTVNLLLQLRRRPCCPRRLRKS